MEFLVAVIALAVWMLIAVVVIGVVMVVFCGIVAMFATPKGNEIACYIFCTLGAALVFWFTILH